MVASDTHIGVAAGSSSGSDATRGWWQWPTVDDATGAYFSALSDGLVADDRGGPANHDPADVGPTVRIARDLPVDGTPLEPFVGARLPEWTAQCVNSRYGVFSSSVFGQFASPMRSPDGETFEVLSVGSIDWANGLGNQDLLDWMAAQARERDIEIREHGQMQRIVFEDGVPVGVVFSTPDGSYSVGTRYGLTISPTESAALGRGAPSVAAGADRMQVCLVAKAASRFARVELLATPSDLAVRRPVCPGSGRELPDELHRSRSKPSEASRCGKVDRYPPRHP